jgi:predicted nucleotidyltransferase
MIGADQAGISAILLFGSRAREDNLRGSDTDLLLIAPPGVPRHRSIGHLSMFFYPWEKLVEDARSGDLFVCHVVREAKPVFDPHLQLDELRSLFRLRASYAREIRQARDLGWFLDRHAGALNSQVAMRRMIWCVRTILIARLAERGTPEFAPAALAAAAPDAAVDLLSGRHQRRLDGSMRNRFRHFMSAEGGKPPLAGDATIDDYQAFFFESDNQVALQTIRSGTAALEDGGFYGD